LIMANRALKKTAKVLGGLGAAYVLSDMLGPKVTGVDPEVEAADREATRKRVEENRVDRLPAPAPAPAPAVEAPLRSRVVIPDFDRDTRDPGLFGVGKKKGGAVIASRRADGIAQRGKTRGKMV
jgi:hypothetical protein